MAAVEDCLAAATHGPSLQPMVEVLRHWQEEAQEPEEQSMQARWGEEGSLRSM